MPEKKDLYEQLQEQGVSKRDLHKTLHHFIMEQAKNGQKPKRRLLDRIKHFYYFKLYFLIRRLKDKALVLLKTQFAKKPKNPV